MSSSSRTVFSVAGASPLSSLNELSISNGQNCSSSGTGSPTKKRSRPPPLPFRLPTEEEEQAERDKSSPGTSTGLAGTGGGSGSGLKGNGDEQQLTAGSPSKTGVAQFFKRKSLDNKDATMKSILRLLAFGGHIPKEGAKKLYPEYLAEKERPSEVSIFAK